MSIFGKMIDDEGMQSAPDIIGAYLIGASDPAEHLSPEKVVLFMIFSSLLKYDTFTSKSKI